VPLPDSGTSNFQLLFCEAELFGAFGLFIFFANSLMAAARVIHLVSFFSFDSLDAATVGFVNFHFPPSCKCLNFVCTALQSSGAVMFVPSSHSDFLFSMYLLNVSGNSTVSRHL
jgi:hypothetical protein